MKMRSDNVTKGMERAPARSLFYAMGYTKEELEDLMKDPDIKTFVLLFDLIVTDRFILEQRDITLTFRGSRNQRIFKIQNSKDMIDVTSEFN